METTGKDYKSIYKVLKENCRIKHPGNKLPRVPWFLLKTYNEKATNILNQLLYDSNFITDDFIEKGTKLLLMHRAEKENHNLKLASLLRENLEIRDKIKLLRESDNKSIGSLKLIESKSDYGPISITLELGGEITNLEVGESIQGSINLKNDVEIKVYAEIGNESIKLDDIFLFFGCAMDDLNHLNLIEKESFTKVIDKGDERYEIKLEVTLSLSNLDKKEVLIQNLYENEILLKEEQENENLYDCLFMQLGIAIKNGKIVSSLKIYKDRGYCDNCLIS